MLHLRLYPLSEEDFDAIIELGDSVHGENYLDHPKLEQILQKSYSGQKCCSYVMYEGARGQGKLIAFRLTYAPGQWEIDEWCTPEEWGVDPAKVCYFKSNTLHPDYRGKGLGLHLLEISKDAVRSLGAEAGVTHIWIASPSRGAFRYFAKAGGKIVWIWPDRWAKEKDYRCVVCCKDGQDSPCGCDAAEMILHFGEQDE